MNREITNFFVVELVIELYGSCFFVVAEEIFQTDLDLLEVPPVLNMLLKSSFDSVP